MGLLEVIFLEIQQPIIFSETDTIGPHFKGVHAHVRKCDICQRCGGRQAKAAGPLKPVMVTEPFE